jgi:hypothetical protein
MRQNGVEIRTGMDIMDFGCPVRGPGGLMYPLTHHRAEDIEIDFVLDVDESELVIAPDVTLLSGGKGIALWLIGMIILVDIVLIAQLPELLRFGKRVFVVTIVSILFVLLTVPFFVGMLRSIRNGNRIEPVMFNKAERTVTHYGKGRPRTYRWESLQPFIRIIRVVSAAGGGQLYQLILADVDMSTRKVKAEFIAAKGDLIGCGVLRYGFFTAYMNQPLRDLPGFRLVSAELNWMQRLAVSLWTVPGLCPRWLGEKPWSMWIAAGSIINIVLAMPLQLPELLAARITLGPYGEDTNGPWPKRYKALATDSPLRGLARHHGDVVVPARRYLMIALPLGTVFWAAVLAFFACAIFNR